MQLPQLSFTRGVIDPALHARVNTADYATGLSEAENAIILPQGGIWNRPGTKYLTDVTIAGSTGEARTIPFIFSVDQSYVLVFVEGRMYVIKDGGIVQSGGSDYYLATGLASVDLSAIRYAQVADELYIVSQSFTPKKITRIADNNWSIASVSFGEPAFSGNIIPDSKKFIAEEGVYADSTGPLGWIYTSYVGDGAEYIYNWALAGDNQIVIPLRWGDGDIVSFGFNALDTSLGWTASTGKPGAYYYATNMGDAAEPDNLFWFIEPTSSTDSVLKGAYVVSSPSGLTNSFPTFSWGDVDTLGYDTLYVRLPGDVAPSALYEYALLSYPDVSYRVYASLSADGPYGLVTESTSPYLEITTSVNPQYGIQPFVDDKPIQTATSTTWPQAVCFQAQRTWYGGASDTPNRMNLSRLGSLDAFGYHTPLRDGDAVDVTIASTQVNGIRHIMPVGDYALVFTDGAIWRAYGAGGIIAPTTLSFDRICDGFIGEARPLMVGDRLLYADRIGRVIELSRADQLLETPIDRSLHAQHLFRGHTIVDWCYQNSPERILWAVRDDGVLLSCTIVPEWDIWAWSIHEVAGTSAKVMSCSSIKVGARDKAYMVVQRTVDGSTVNYIEELQDRYITDIDDSWFLDSALGYTGGGISNPSGLDHLEGETVYALADGETLGPFTVSSGAISLGDTYSDVVVGLPYTTTIRTLDVNAPDGSLYGVFHNIVKVRMKIRDSLAFECGQLVDNLYTIMIPEYDYTSSTTDLSTGVLSVNVDGNWSRNGGLIMRNSNPTPMTVDAIVPEFEAEA